MKKEYNNKEVIKFWDKELKESEDDFGWAKETLANQDPAKKFIYDLMTGLEISESKKRSGWMVYKDKKGNILMADNINTGVNEPYLYKDYLYVDYYRIWKKLSDMGLEEDKIKLICKEALEDLFGRKVVTTREYPFLYEFD